ncbi:unnamed protein product, partial [Amoebophrya sp. A120]
ASSTKSEQSSQGFNFELFGVTPITEALEIPEFDLNLGQKIQTHVCGKIDARFLATLLSKNFNKRKSFQRTAAGSSFRAGGADASRGVPHSGPFIPSPSKSGGEEYEMSSGLANVLRYRGPNRNASTAGKADQETTEPEPEESVVKSQVQMNHEEETR